MNTAQCWGFVTRATFGLAALLFVGCVGSEPVEGEAQGSLEQALDLPQPLPSPWPIDPKNVKLPLPFATQLAAYSGYDINGDGTIEIESLSHVLPVPPSYVPRPKGILVVLVEPRLLSDATGATISGATMKNALAVYANDLWQEGYYPLLLAADVYAGAKHQDGRTLLAMRRFLKQLDDDYYLSGTVLVGSFPEAGVVRTTLTREHAAKKLFKSVMLYDIDYLFVNVEYVAARAEIVLADLNGNWEQLYREKFTHSRFEMVPSFIVLPGHPIPSHPQSFQHLEAKHFNRNDANAVYDDVFVVDDAQVEMSQSGNILIMDTGDIDEPGPETTELDRLQPNRIARPEITVSRINALHVAIEPTVSELDLDGKGPLDAQGKPQSLRYSKQVKVEWQRDPTLERQLLLDYFARAHQFRQGGDNQLPFRTSAIRERDSGLDDPIEENEYLKKASSSFGAPVAKDDADMVDYFKWLKIPAVLRGIGSHSTELSSDFAAPPTTADLENALGGKPWAWKTEWQDTQWVVRPTFEELTKSARFNHYRTAYENGLLASTGSMFIVHVGCDMTKPPNHRSEPYNSPFYGQGDAYGAVQNGESLLFYGNGLGLMGRSKVFNDRPPGYPEAIAFTGRFGHGWRAYFTNQAAKKTDDVRGLPFGGERRERTLRRKSSYYWNLLGDYSLKIRYP